MRSTVVPAQITTVEDKIAGSLGLSQLILLTVPIFGGSALFVFLPPFFNYATYKVVLITVFATLCGLLAIRIKGKILLLWGVVLLRYNSRPRYYVFNKNDAHLRDTAPVVREEKAATQTTAKDKPRLSLPKLSTAELVHAESILANPSANLRLEITKKGGLNVRFTEVR